MASKAFTINRRQVAYLLGVDERTVTTWQSLSTNPLPVKKVGGRGKPNEYDPSEIVQWYLAKKVGEIAVDGDGNYIDYEHEKARLTKNQADQAAIKNAQLRGELAPIALLEWSIGRMGAQVSAALDAIPSKIKRAVPGIGATPLEIVRKEIVKAQNIAATAELNVDEYRDSDPDQKGR